MRIVMPLFEFNYTGKEFSFTNSYSLKHFDFQNEIPDHARVGLSELDRSYLSIKNWAVIATDPKEDFKAEINLLLIAFRIYAKSNVFIKWRFCKEDQKYSTCLNEKFRNLATATNLEITEELLSCVKNGFLHIKDMYSVSDRTKNALYFIWRGLCAEKHIDAYIFLVCATEALFSSETTDELTKTFIKRTQKFLSGTKGCGGDQIKEIYKIRSGMVHGRISHTGKNDKKGRQKNIENLAKLENLVFACLQKMLQTNAYQKYKTIKEKEDFLNDLICCEE